MIIGELICRHELLSPLHLRLEGEGLGKQLIKQQTAYQTASSLSNSKQLIKQQAAYQNKSFLHLMFKSNQIKQLNTYASFYSYA